jgi:hypothetical protein
MTDLSFPPIRVDFQSDDDLGSQITRLAGHINAANHCLLKLIGEFDRRKAWSGGGTVRSCAHWLNWKCGIALVAAREKVRVAHCLEELPQIDAAFAAGEISYSKVRAMTRVATPENEDYLLNIARHGTASHVEMAVRKYRRVLRENENAVEQLRESKRELSYYQDEEGMWVIRAKLPPEEGALVVKAIEAASEKEDSAESFSQRRVDALSRLAEHYLATSDEGIDTRALKGSERCQVVLHVSIDTLRQQSHDSHCHHGPCHTEEGTWLAPDTARRLSCDAALVTVLEGECGNILNIGRRSRTVPAHIERALKIRDKTCRFPGCCETRYVDAHHIKHWADGGETSLDNLVTLCRYHHRLLHQRGFTITAHKNVNEMDFVFKTPGGGTLPGGIYPQFSNDSAESFENVLEKIAPQVDATTCVTRWQGENCDYSMLVEGLLKRSKMMSDDSAESYCGLKTAPDRAKRNNLRLLGKLG